MKLDVFLYPLIAVWLERHYYVPRDQPSSSKSSWFRPRSSRGHVTITSSLNQIQAVAPTAHSTESPAIVVNHLIKKFRTSMFPKVFRPWLWFSHNYESDPDAVTAIADLSFSVPRSGIFVLLGSNGAGKSTVLGILAGLIGGGGGSVVFPPPGAPSSVSDKDSGGGTEWDGPSRPPNGGLGIVPQKNVLFPELTCFQTMQLWSAVKRPNDHHSDTSFQRHVHVEETPEELRRLLMDCGLEGKLHSNAGSLSGGQKRKLQLAIGLVGGSESESSLV